MTPLAVAHHQSFGHVFRVFSAPSPMARIKFFAGLSPTPFH